MAVLPSPQSTHKFYQADGVTPAAAYELYTYAAGTTTPVATYSDAAGVSANTNPIILNSNGEASIYISTGISYDLVLKVPGGGAQVGATQRVIAGETQSVSISSFGGNDNGVFDNLSAYTTAKGSLPTGAVIKFPRMSATGNYYISGSPDFTGVYLDIDPGVIISGSFAASSAIRVTSASAIRITSQSYDYDLTPEYKKPWAGKSIWLNEGDKNQSTSLAINTSSELSHYSNTYLSSDTFSTVVPSVVGSDTVTWASSDTTQLFCSLYAARAGDQVSAAFATGGLYTRVAVIRTTGGYHLVTAPGNGGSPSLRAKATGASATGNTFTYSGLSTHESYYPENCVWSIRLYDRQRYAVLMNGLEVTDAQVANGDIIEVGFGWVPSATVTAVSVVGFALTRGFESSGKKNITILCHGDSMTEDLHAGWPYFFREAIDGTNGIRVDNIINAAVGGETSAQQKTRLLANGVQGAQYTFICVGTNDIQQGVAASTTVTNIGDMIDYCAANGSTPIIWIPPLWYSQALAGGGGQATSNYQAGAQTRALIARLAGTKSVKCVDMTQVLGPALVTYKTGASVYGFDPMLRDNIHPTAYGYRLIGYTMARALFGQYCPPITREKSSTFLPTNLTSNGWALLIQPARYSVDAVGNVCLSGVIDAGTTTDGTVMYTLPRHLRPIANARFVCPTNSGTCRLTVYTNGQIACEGASGVVWIALDPIHFLASSS